MSNWKPEILSHHIGLRHGYQFRETDFTENGIHVIKIGNVTADGLNLDADVSYVSALREKEFESIIIKDGDILMSLTGNIGRVVEVKNLGGKILFQNYRVGVFYPLKDNIFKPYIKWIMSSDDILRQLNSHSNQSAQANFGKQDLDKLKFKIPSLPEQRQIAQILSTADAVIEKTQAAIAKYKAIKQGMLHDLFTRGIDLKTGKLRSKYEVAPELYKPSKLGMVPKDWAVEESNTAVKFINGRAYSIHEWETSGIPVIRLQNLTGSGENYYYSNLELPENQYCKRGDLLYMWSATFGPHIWKGDKAIFHYHIWKVECSKKMNQDYFYYDLLKFTETVLNGANGSTMAHITKEGMDKRLTIIPSIEEQEAISKRFLAIDKQLQSEQNYLQKLQQIKAGLMSDLLSGKVKVKL